MTVHGRVTLGVLVDSLGPDVVQVLSMPRGREILIGAPVIYDPEEPMKGLDGAVLLATGRPSAQMIARAGEAGVAVVVVKPGSCDATTLAEAAHAAGTALLAAASDLSWGQLYTLIDALLAVVAPATEQVGGASRAPDLFALANQVAVRVGGAVAIEDLAMRVLAYSTVEDQKIDELRREGILGRRVPEHPTNTGEYSAVLRADGAVWSYEPVEFYPRLAIAVRAHGEALGTIWAVQSETPLAADAADILADAALAAAPHLAKISLAADEARRRRDECLGRLLRGMGPARGLAASFGLLQDEPLTVVTIGPHTGPSDAFAATHAGDLLRTAYASYRMRAAAGAVDGHAYAIVAADSALPLLRKITGDTLDRVADRIGGRWRAGVSRTAPSLAALPAAARQADEALRALCGPFATTQVGGHAELAAALFLMEVDSSVRDTPAKYGEPLNLIADHDQRQGTHYLRTLRVWMAAHYDVPKAAETLSLHPNTLRYRLRRIGELIDLDDYDTRLVLGLQLRLRDIAANDRPDDRPAP
ncbi:DNA-binding transcriptional regulator, PucR family [Sinosporangium album]|uniref:DNA-binding transcriptional regulator, PucR family n=1 Tax=Sinosporangium album TaxID=504805 RepID=A0A1G7Z1X1_9ACTN|nr:PucR family transcriptional regulator [Sinosporangium album]SDH02496.1 DNA-binding transcriptional regulator, PucR family [Sinosporangium album]